MNKKQATKVSEVQLVLCEDVVCLKSVIVVWRSPLQRSLEQLFSNCYCLYKGITKKRNCSCVHKVVNSDTQNCANNK